MSGGFPQFRRNDGGDVPPKQKELNEERYEHPDKGQPELHVYEDNHTGEWCVWLNTGIADHDGLCIGHGSTRQEAIADAVNVVEWAEGELQGPPPLPADAAAHGVDMQWLRAKPQFHRLPPCWPTKRYVRFFEGAWQEADDIEGPWSRVARQRDSSGHTSTS